jgi:hypothetical protein
MNSFKITIMGSKENRERIDKFRSNWENDPETDDQIKKIFSQGDDPSSYRGTKGEADRVIRANIDDNLQGKLANYGRKGRKWLEDDI